MNPANNIPAFLSALVGLAGMVIYAVLIDFEGHSVWSILPIAGLMVLAAAAAYAGGRVVSARKGHLLLLGAAAIFGGIGLIAILSIGIIFLTAAVLAAVGAVRRRGPAELP